MVTSHSMRRMRTLRTEELRHIKKENTSLWKVKMAMLLESLLAGRAWVVLNPAQERVFDKGRVLKEILRMTNLQHLKELGQNPTRKKRLQQLSLPCLRL